MIYYNMGIPCETFPANCCGIYLIRNLINNKIYIGQSVDIKRRIQEHLRSAQPDKYSIKSLKDSKTHIHLAMQKYGINNFSVDIIELTNDRKQLDDLEKKWILLLRSNNPNIGYNETIGGQKCFSQKGEKHGQAKLTQQEVNDIKFLLKNTKMTLGEISQKYNNISKSTLSMINQGKIWNDNQIEYPIRKTNYGSSGDKNPRAKFTNEQVMEIRTKYSNVSSLSELQEEYSNQASKSTIKAIIYGESFKNLPVWSKKTKSWK